MDTPWKDWSGGSVLESISDFVTATNLTNISLPETCLTDGDNCTLNHTEVGARGEGGDLGTLQCTLRD